MGCNLLANAYLLCTVFFTDPARASTLLLTSLMVIGLVFFIRASTKDRIEVMQFSSRQDADALRQAVIKYFYSRAYKPLSEDESTQEDSDGPTILNGMTFVGMVSPSIFMAVFLSVLAAVGFACLGLVMVTLFPGWGGAVLALVLVSPLAGVFYWRKSSRPETIVLRVDALDEAAANLSEREEALANKTGESQDRVGSILSKLIVKGHRDELADLQIAFSQPDLQAWAGLKKWEAAE